MNKYILTTLLTLPPIVIAGIAIEQIVLNFTSIGNIELIIFASLIGYGIGVLTSLIVISMWSVASYRLDSLVGILFWHGAYFHSHLGVLLVLLLEQYVQYI